MDDKYFVIFALLMIAICLIWIDIPQCNVNIINNIISGMLGLAVGKNVSKRH